MSTTYETVCFFAHLLLRDERSTKLILEKMKRMGVLNVRSLLESHEPFLWLEFPFIPPTHASGLGPVNIKFYLFPVFAEHFYEDVLKEKAFGPVQRGISSIIESEISSGKHPYLGLGALTKNATGHGMGILQHYMQHDPSMVSRFSITHGDAGTAALLIEALSYAGIKGDGANIAILGATGAIGSVTAKMLAKKSPNKMLLVGRNVDRLTKLSTFISEHNPEVQVLTNTESEREIKSTVCIDENIQIVIVATTGVRLLPEILPPRCVIFDTTTPSACRISDDWGDRIVIRAGCGQIDNPTVIPEGFGPNGSGSLWDIGAGGENVAWGCFLETVCRAAVGTVSSHSVGKDIPWQEVQWCKRQFGILGIHPQPVTKDGVVVSWGTVRNQIQALIGADILSSSNASLSTLEGAN
ncbi:MAG: hypothetical protein CL685_00385 [Candidatus Magasanikbacteria bacterium]|nr:hypothetical protein [Candidatus Magasanikbacteria bacterium]|tara:strand:- start:655 stop:1887 length:1233 start_codon:yes stop_codon:yes gene_type:complete